MVSAEIQRIVLLVGLAVVGYLMIRAWNDDYHRPVTVPAVTHAPSVEAPAATGGADVPKADAVTAPRNSDVPEAVTATAPAAEPTGGHVAAPSTDRLIRVDTHALSVWIDRLGGDIVRVQMPRYPLSVDQPDVPYLLLDNGDGRTYVAQSGLIGRDGPDASASRPLYSADAARYDLSASGGTVVLRADADRAQVEKRLTFTADDYLVAMEITVHNERSTPFEAGLFAQLKRDKSEPFGQTSSRVGPKPYLGAALTTAPEERYVKLKFESLDDGAYRHDVKGGWIAILQHYFISAWVADAETSNHYFGHKKDDGTYVVGYTGPVVQVAPGETGRFGARFYAGPKDQSRLEALAPNLNLTVDYGFLWWLAVPLFRVLQWFHGVVGNWGVAIILLTLLVKVVLYPLSAASYKSMANMRRVAPQIKRLQERHADDRQKLSQEMMALYQKEKMNPLGGCLPMVLQMPVFLSLYWVLFESVELRQSPFFGWIRDLSVMDPYFVLPILMGVSMFFQMQLNPPPPDPMQARVMKFMPIVFTVMFLFFPAGLVLYWLVNNILSMAQQWLITRQVEGGQSKSRA